MIYMTGEALIKLLETNHTNAIAEIERHYNEEAYQARVAHWYESSVKMVEQLLLDIKSSDVNRYDLMDSFQIPMKPRRLGYNSLQDELSRENRRYTQRVALANALTQSAGGVDKNLKIANYQSEQLALKIN